MGMSVGSGGSRSRRGASRRTPMAEINVTPFVDVMLVLLIIFMVTAPLMTSAVPVDLPDSRANPSQGEAEDVTVTIDADGYIYIGDERVAVGGFPDALAALERNAGETPQVTLRADRALDYGRVMAVMGELNRAGFNAISLVTNGSATAP
ncbi:ExbD/TolR family protein [Pseudopontixanthobacter vadosimaris]|uniref:ExbD/TolR family protein n=1 Tax=Pseudopontixanthobacter vadosimaris TaxID=2726450 RepID=UPI0014737D48|nr:ExbD/TolR family protein [Pseudopontixanthobacter vadosimaris]